MTRAPYEIDPPALAGRDTEAYRRLAGSLHDKRFDGNGDRDLSHTGLVVL